jgi:Ca-activated chloride channel family protein
MNVSFNPNHVKEYRLIGFDNKLGALSDSLSSVEGGEIGSGHSMQAVFEIVPFDKKIDTNQIEEFAEINLRYIGPDDTVVQEKVYKCSYNFTPFDKVDKCYQFYSSIIMFGSLLKGSPFIKSAGWNDILAIATKSAKEDDRLQMEFIEVVQKAKNLYTKQKKKKGKSSQSKKTSL